MKVIDAAWEKRNMGISCVEINVEGKESVQELESVLAQITADYVVVKTPTCRMKFSELLCKNGFFFVETMFFLEKELRVSCLSQERQEKINHMTYYLNLAESKERIQDEIRMGMYTTDRVSLDGHFSLTQASNRYIGMLTDELSRGAELLECCYDGVPFGFSCIRQTGPEQYNETLDGVYRAFRGKGLGFVVSHLPELELLKRKAAKLTTSISTNNGASLRAHLKNGFLPIGTIYVYVKHK